MPYNIYLDLSRSYSTVNGGRGGVHDDLPACPELIPLYQDYYDYDAVCDHACAAVIMESATAGQPPPLPQVDAAVIMEPATAGHPPPLPQVDAAVIMESATAGHPPPLPQACAAVIMESATAGQPPPLPQACASVIMEPATVGQPPPLPQAAAGIGRRAASRQPTADYSGKPCGCGCGKILEYKQYKTCPGCAYNKIRMPCWGNGNRCTACNQLAERYNNLPTV